MEWRPPLLCAYPLGHRVLATLKKCEKCRKGLVETHARCARGAQRGARGAYISLRYDMTDAAVCTTGTGPGLADEGFPIAQPCRWSSSAPAVRTVVGLPDTATPPSGRVRHTRTRNVSLSTLDCIQTGADAWQPQRNRAAHVQIVCLAVCVCSCPTRTNPMRPRTSVSTPLPHPPLLPLRPHPPILFGRCERYAVPPHLVAPPISLVALNLQHSGSCPLCQPSRPALEPPPPPKVAMDAIPLDSS